jgi:hypothetical protein
MNWIIGQVRESPMKWVFILLGVVLIVAAGYGFVASLDLLTTQIGLLYAVSAAIALGAGLVILCMAGVVHRVDALRKAILRQAQTREATIGVAPPISVEVETPTRAEETAAKEEASLPPPIVAEPPPIAVEAPPMDAPFMQAPPMQAPHMETPPMTADAEADDEPAPLTLVGRYSAGGANYSIFSDGSIEAETDQGAFHFASMSEFKAYVAAKRA